MITQYLLTMQDSLRSFSWSSLRKSGLKRRTRHFGKVRSGASRTRLPRPRPVSIAQFILFAQLLKQSSLFPVFKMSVFFPGRRLLLSKICQRPWLTKESWRNLAHVSNGAARSEPSVVRKTFIMIFKYFVSLRLKLIIESELHPVLPSFILFYQDEEDTI